MNQTWRNTTGGRLAWALERMPPEGKSKGIGLLISRIEGTTGATYPSIGGYLKDRVTPPIEFIAAAAKALGVRAEWLAFGIGEPTDLLESKRRRAEDNERLKRHADTIARIERVFPEFSELPGYVRVVAHTLAADMAMEAGFRAQDAGAKWSQRQVDGHVLRIISSMADAIYRPLLALGSPLVEESPNSAAFSGYVLAVLQAFVLAMPVASATRPVEEPEGGWRKSRARMLRDRTGPTNEDARHPGEE